ncbi:MAG TPA: tRNA modification GTPase [Gemmataceae bacterium]|nr:tRNA modification GTPase [Gemmataceae bacterium]
MSLDLNDTIVALSSAPGPGARAVVRLSGPDAFRCASALFAAAEPVAFNRRRLYPGRVRLRGVAAPLPADLYVFPAPHTFTGQHVAELHTLGCPPLVDVLIAELLKAGARAARPGEFTLRAFLGGKLDLTRAEAVLGVIEAGSRDELKEALAQLAGGIAGPLQELRGDLLDLLADLEAGLDFAEEDVHFVSTEDQLRRLGKGLALLTLLGKQLEQRSLGGRTFRAVLAGRPNAGKSSLFNALGGGSALVSPEPGTTRDYLVRRIDLDGVPVELIDTAGWQTSAGSIEGQAQALGREQACGADLVLLCVEAGREPDAEERARLGQAAPPVLGVATKCDLARPSFGEVATSAATGEGLDTLRGTVAARAQALARPALAPSVSRCRHHVAACLGRLRQAHQTVLFGGPPELAALELRGALDELGEMVGAVYTDDLLDRIFSRFCIGK